MIGTTLDYFLELEYATRLLNLPGESLFPQTDISIWSSVWISALSFSNPTYDLFFFCVSVSQGFAHTL